MEGIVWLFLALIVALVALGVVRVFAGVCLKSKQIIVLAVARQCRYGGFQCLGRACGWGNGSVRIAGRGLDRAR
jgi:hypothetical protein